MHIHLFMLTSILVFFEHLRKKNLNCSETDVLWVLTVPAIWDDSAKLLMRQAAVAAGLEMEDGQLMLALEPEAASLWCLASGGVSLEKDDVYMVVDCGGGTVDITVHQVERVDTRHPLVKEGMYSVVCQTCDNLYRFLPQLIFFLPTNSLNSCPCQRWKLGIYEYRSQHA